MTLRIIVVALGCLALAFASPEPASAHGRYPETAEIAFHPTDPMKIAVQTTFGSLLTLDGGVTWRWICREILNISLQEDPWTRFTEDDGLVVATFNGVLRSDDGGCSWSFPSASLTNEVAFHMVPHPTNPAGVFVVTSPGGSPNQVFLSEDNGRTWTAPPDPIAEVGFISERMAVAPSNPDILYVSGIQLATEDTPREVLVYRTDDGGLSWTRAVVDPGPEGRKLQLLTVHPGDPNVVLARTVPETDSDEPQRLLRTGDGGQTWNEVLAMPQIGGATFDATGDRLWVGGTQDEMDQATLHLSTDAGATFSPVTNDYSFGCLAWRDDGLWACAQNFQDGFAIGRSTDGGESFTPVLEFQRGIVGLVECDEAAPTSRICVPALEDLTNDLALAETGDFPDAGMPVPDGGRMDGGPGNSSPSGCGCYVAGSSPGIPTSYLVLIGLGVALFHRRRVSG